MDNLIKISFLGDITCDRPMLKAALKDGKYDFKASLEGIKSVIAESEYSVGNIETVFAGKKYGYNPNPISYNSPDELCRAIKEAGISMLTTANNHCLDMGGRGIDRTIRLLEKLGIEYTGTYPSGYEGEERFLIKEIKGIRIAFVSLTACLNSRADGTMHSQEEWEQVNTLKKYKASVSGNPYKEKVKKLLPMEKINRVKASIKRARGIALVTARTDDNDIPQNDFECIGKAKELLKRAGEKADYVIACVHCGGQFNDVPGRYSVQMYNELQPYCDAIIGNHPHVVQKAEISGDKIRAYSLGSVNMSMSADYVSHEYFPDYSVVLHLFLAKDSESGKVRAEKITYSLLQSQEDENKYIHVKSCVDYDEKAQDVADRFVGKTNIEKD
ncbi:MAG: CapA family protein [Ruminococcus sp.]|nr:CapA family protein [Ruminococcus sp.]